MDKNTNQGFESTASNVDSIEYDEKRDDINLDQMVVSDDENYSEVHHHHRTHSHSHHSGHRSHHRRRRNSSKKKNNKFLAFMKKHRSVLVNIISCTFSVVLLIIFAVNVDFSRPEKGEDNYVNITQTTVSIETSFYPDKVVLVNDAIVYYMDSNNDSSATEVYKLYSGYKNALNEGVPVSFTYRVVGLPTNVEARSAELEISENDDYRDALVYQLNLDESSIDLYNLKTATKYYYRVSLVLNDDCVIGTTGSFETEQSPRILKIDGAVNVRDIGGWVTENGRVVQQGLLFRGSELDGSVEPDYKITDSGLQQMIGNLGVRFDMDLRASHENKEGTDALGKNVVHEYYGVGMYSDILGSNYNENVRRIFADLADVDNYPIYMHCTYGRDRTGSVCYLLEALLGVSDEDLRKDYDLSAFTDSYVNNGEFNAFVEKINTFDGETTQKKVEGYLRSIGVTNKEIASIREIFLEE